MTIRRELGAGTRRAPALASRHVALRAVRSTDLDRLYELIVIHNGTRSRFRGRTPSLAEFQAELWVGVHAQFVVEDRAHRIVGLVGLYNTNLVAGHSHVFATSDPDGGPLTAEAAGLVIDWAFDEFELSKIWIETTEYNLAQFESISEIATTEGSLTNHEYWRGRFWDLRILSISAIAWRDRYGALADGLVGRPAAEPLDRASIPSVPTVAELEELVRESWPLDSLATVEVVCAVEEHLGRVITIDELGRLPSNDPAEFLRALLGETDGAATGRRLSSA